jgi:hypothetical protein
MGENIRIRRTDRVGHFLMVQHQLSPSNPPDYINPISEAKIKVHDFFRFLRTANGYSWVFPLVKPKVRRGLLSQELEQIVINSHIPGSFTGRSVNDEMPVFFHGVS